MLSDKPTMILVSTIAWLVEVSFEDLSLLYNSQAGVGYIYHHDRCEIQNK